MGWSMLAQIVHPQARHENLTKLNATPRAEGLRAEGATPRLRGMAFASFIRRRRLTAWLISCVMGLAALMPTLSAWAMSTRVLAPWAEVCSVQGTRWVQGSDAAPRHDPAAQHGQAHCAFCVLQDHSPFLPVSAMAVATPVAMSDDMLPPLFLRASRALHAWSPAAARAPPASV